MKRTVYDFDFIDNRGEKHSLREFEGKILLFVNTATHSSFTEQYFELEKTYQKYKEEGFEILDFPCDQFHGECPESDEEIDEIIKENYHTTFLRCHKGEVNGENALPLFLFLQSEAKFKDFDKGEPSVYPIVSLLIKKDPLWRKKNDIKWNFTKFLVDRYGSVRKRFECSSKEKDIDRAIEKIIDTQG